MPNPSVGGALIKVVKDTNLVSGRVFRLSAAAKKGERIRFPYVTLADPFSSVPALDGDCKTIARSRLEQLDLWQQVADLDPLLFDKLVDAVDGAVLNATPRVYGCKVTDAREADDPDAAIAHHFVIVRVTHGRT